MALGQPHPGQGPALSPGLRCPLRVPPPAEGSRRRRAGQGSGSAPPGQVAEGAGGAEGPAGLQLSASGPGARRAGVVAEGGSPTASIKAAAMALPAEPSERRAGGGRDHGDGRRAGPARPAAAAAAAPAVRGECGAPGGEPAAGPAP